MLQNMKQEFWEDTLSNLQKMECILSIYFLRNQTSLDQFDSI